MRQVGAAALRLIPAWILGCTLLLLAGCAAGGALIPADAPQGHAPESSGDIDAAALLVGDCINAVDGDLRAGLDSVPCTERHDWEVYADLSVTGAGVPAGDWAADALATAEEGCGAAFLQFLGLDSAEGSSLGYTYLISADGAGIAPGNRDVHCLIGDLGGPVTGSLAGVAR
jgi:hypothetical protein